MSTVARWCCCGALEYACDYVDARYANQRCHWTFHKERCKMDGTDCYAAYIAINRADHETGRRLDEGGARAAARARVFERIAEDATDGSRNGI